MILMKSILLGDVLDALRLMHFSCSRCDELCASRSKIVLPDLPSRARTFLAIGEAPGAEEDAQGKGFVGRAGKTLHALLASEGFTRGLDYGCANVVRCRPPGNRKPTAQEIANCHPYFLRTVTACSLRAVLAVGNTAALPFFENFGKNFSLLEKITWLEEHNYDPVNLFLPGGSLESTWPKDGRLVIIPHTSPLAWNRNAPNGKKWSEIGREQVKKLRKFLLSTTPP